MPGFQILRPDCIGTQNDILGKTHPSLMAQADALTLPGGGRADGW